jgi:hypothetical protein
VGKQSRKAVAGEATQGNNPYAIGVLSRAFDILAIFSHAKPSLSHRMARGAEPNGILR